MKGHFVDQEIAPRETRSVHYGNTGRVLIRDGRCRLIWRKGATAHYRMGDTSYSPAHMCALGENRRFGGDGTLGNDLFKGGRLTLKRIKENLAKIREAMALPGLTMEHFDLRKTYVVDEPRRKWCHHCHGLIVDPSNQEERRRSDRCMCTRPIARTYPPKER